MKKLILHFHLGCSGGGVKIEGGVDLSMIYGTTVWWFERGLKDIGGSRTLVSNWWLVNSFLGPKKLVAPEK